MNEYRSLNYKLRNNARCGHQAINMIQKQQKNCKVRAGDRLRRSDQISNSNECRTSGVRRMFSCALEAYLLTFAPTITINSSGESTFLQRRPTHNMCKVASYLLP